MTQPQADHEHKALEVKTATRPVIGAGLLALALLFLIGGSWAVFASIAGAVIAPGQIAIPGKPKTVQHLDGGIVAGLHVDNGSKVDAGDVLIRLDDALLKANLNIYETRLREGLAKKARLIAERDQTDTITWDNAILELLQVELDPSVTKGQEKLFKARHETRYGQVLQLREKIAQLENQADGIKALNRSRATQIGFLDEELSGMHKLNRKGLVLKSRLMALERQRQELIGQRAENEAELARIQNAIGETEIQILQIDREFRESVLDELRTIEQEVNDTTQQFVATSEQLKRIEIRAPVTGIVHELNAFTVGGVIAPGEPVMQIVPAGDQFEIEANVEPQFVDELYPGQPASLRFSAFNQRTTPELEGSVKSISANTVIDEQTGLAHYRILLAVSDEELARLGNQPLVPGMPVEAFIKTRDRTPLNYLLKPLTDQIARAFREE